MRPALRSSAATSPSAHGSNWWMSRPGLASPERSRRRIGIEVLPRSEWRVLDPMVIAWRLESHDRTAQIASLTEVREAVEPLAARLAARNASNRQATLL